jgi:hypothetical protein
MNTLGGIDAQRQNFYAKDLLAAQGEQTKVLREDELFRQFSGGVGMDKAPPEVVNAFNTLYAYKTSQAKQTGADALTAKNKLGIGTDTRAEELGQLAHPYNKTLTTTEGRTKNAMATGREQNVPLAIAAERSNFATTPYKNAAELNQMSFMPVGDRFVRYDVNTGGNTLTTLPTPDPFAEEGQPPPGPTSTSLDSDFITLSDGTKIPQKRSNNAFNDIMGRQPTSRVVGKTDEKPAPPTTPMTATEFKDPQEPIIQGSGLLPSSINLPAAAQRILPTLEKYKGVMGSNFGERLKSYPMDLWDFYTGKGVAPGQVGPQVSPALPLPKRPNYR